MIYRRANRVYMGGTVMRGVQSSVKEPILSLKQRRFQWLTLTTVLAIVVLGPTVIVSQIVDCGFEPDWRPTHYSVGTLHVVAVNRTSVVVALRGFHLGDEAKT